MPSDSRCAFRSLFMALAIVCCPNGGIATTSIQIDVSSQHNCTEVVLSGANITENPCLLSPAAVDDIGAFAIIVCQPICTLTHCDIAALFASSPHVQRLQLDRNNLTALSALSFRKAGHLSELELSYNRFEMLLACQFCGADQLQSLRLSHNRLRVVHEMAFDGLPNLAEIFLDHNRLLRFEAHVPPTVEALYVQGNGLQVVSASMIGRNLRQLDVSNNALERFDASVFSDDSRLEWLSVSRNRLSTLHNITVSHLRLRQLDASDNPIATYAIFTFAPLQRLETLRLRAAGLRTFGHGLFGEHAPVHLRVLDIGANRLHQADWTVLGALHALRDLSVANSRLSDVGAIDGWLEQPQPTDGDGDRALVLMPLAKRLDRLWLAGNRFNCSYLLRLQSQLRPDVVASEPAQAMYMTPNVNGVPCAESAASGSGGRGEDETPVAATEVCLTAWWWTSVCLAIVAIVEGMLLVAGATVVWRRWQRLAKPENVVTWDRLSD